MQWVWNMTIQKLERAKKPDQIHLVFFSCFYQVIAASDDLLLQNKVGWLSKTRVFERFNDS